MTAGEQVGTVYVSGSFDNLSSREVRFLQEAARLGPLHVLLWADELAGWFSGRPPAFPQAERLYLLDSLRYVRQVSLVESLPDPDSLPSGLPGGGTWAVDEAGRRPARQEHCRARGYNFQVIREEALAGFPIQAESGSEPAARKKALVTGCYDWLHSGHVRFFEEVEQLGDLYVVVGHDENVRLLKGEGHPLFPQYERRYMVQSIRFVTQALISTGWGWMDAEPQIAQLRPELYVVNEDGDRPEKRAFCQAHGLEYVVLKRLPKEGLPPRESTRLRGF
jgi:cytidyltransferase-like protein